MEVERQIDVFDTKTEALVEEVPINSFDLEKFSKRFSVKNDDPLMYDPYEVTSATADLFPKVKFDFEKYSYYLACYQAGTDKK